MFVISFVTSEGLFWAKLAAAGTMAMLPVVILGWPAQSSLSEVSPSARSNSRGRGRVAMRAFTITAAGVGEVRDVPRPDPGPGEAIVKVARVEVCGTDYRIYHGEFNSRFPLVSGHEFSGVVSDVGADVVDWHPGDRVAVDPTLYCGHCYTASAASPIIATIGGRSVTPATAPWRVRASPGSEPLPRRRFGRAGRSGPHGAARVRGLGGRATPVDARKPCPDLRRGTDRFLLTALLSASGTADVTVVDVVDSKLEIARRFGASATFFTTGPDLDAILRERRQGRGYDAVIDCTGVPSVIEGLFRHVARMPDHVLRGRPLRRRSRSVRSMSTTRTGRSWDRWRSTTPSSSARLVEFPADRRPVADHVVDLDVGDILRRPGSGRAQDARRSERGLTVVLPSEAADKSRTSFDQAPLAAKIARPAGGTHVASLAPCGFPVGRPRSGGREARRVAARASHRRPAIGADRGRVVVRRILSRVVGRLAAIPGRSPARDRYDSRGGPRRR